MAARELPSRLHVVHESTRTDVWIGSGSIFPMQSVAAHGKSQRFHSNQRVGRGNAEAVAKLQQLLCHRPGRSAFSLPGNSTLRYCDAVWSKANGALSAAPLYSTFSWGSYR